MRGTILTIQKSVAASDHHTRCILAQACVVTTQAWASTISVWYRPPQASRVFNKTTLSF